VTETELATSDGQIQEAQGALQVAQDEYEMKAQLLTKDAVARREVDRLANTIETRKGSLGAAVAKKETLEAKIRVLLPAQKASAEAALAQAQVELDKTLVRAGISGTVQQFTLRTGDVVNTMIRPAGILVPTQAGRGTLIAGFGQIEAQVMKRGMIAEATCIGKPFTIIPLVVTEVQDVIAAGQLRPTDQLDRCPADGPAGHAYGLPATVVRGRPGRHPAGQQLHRQRLYEQSRCTGRQEYRDRAVAVPARRGHRRPRARNDPAYAGDASPGSVLRFADLAATYSPAS
jgi:hypothetical protein